MEETEESRAGGDGESAAPAPPSIDDLRADAIRMRQEISEAVAAANIASASAKEAQGTIAALLADLQSKVSDIGSIASQATTAKTAIDDAQAVIAAKSEHIEGAQTHADKVRASLDRLQTAATQSANEADGARERAQGAADTATTKLGEIQSVRAQADTELTALTTLGSEAKGDAERTKRLAEKADGVTDTLKGYERRLADLEKQCAAQLKAIESVLPGATSVGLASSFELQKARFKRPQRNWLIAGVVALVGLFLVGAIGLPGLWGSAPVPEGFDGGILKHILTRLPLAIPLIWLAIYAGHNYMVALRMEEDYAFKEAVSRAFEGYKREMTGIPGASASDTAPLVTLCTNVLTALAERPGRIYEGKQENITPMSQIVSSLKELTESVSALKK